MVQLEAAGQLIAPDLVETPPWIGEVTCILQAAKDGITTKTKSLRTFMFSHYRIFLSITEL